MKQAGFTVGVLLLGAACNVDSDVPDTGGVDAGGAPGQGSGCPAGVTVVLSDYLSTQVALGDVEGNILSEAFISTASSITDGLTFALGGDVVVPSEPAPSGRVVLLDRFGTNVVTWVDPATAEVSGQLALGTGFESNPLDYVEVDERLAFVSRSGINATPGAQVHDTGNDLLVIDTLEPEIVDSIPLPFYGELPPRPSSLLRHGAEVIVTLDRYAADFSTTGAAMYAGVSIEERKVVWQTTLEDYKACGQVALAPDGDTAAIACTGRVRFDGSSENIAESALLLVAIEPAGIRIEKAFAAEALAGEPIKSNVTFADQHTLLFRTQTPLGGTTHNRLLALDLRSEQVVTLLEAGPDTKGVGKGIVYSGVACAPGCTTTCVMADADRDVLQRLRITAAGPELLDEVPVDTRSGLPPLTVAYR